MSSVRRKYCWTHGASGTLAAYGTPRTSGAHGTLGTN